MSGSACNSSTSACDPATYTCKKLDGQLCAASSDCLNNACNTFYPDADGDGYGTNNAAKFCGPKPAGYATIAGDCCDQDNRVFPNEQTWYSSANLCGSYDYNCDGSLEMQNAAAVVACNANCDNGNPDCADMSFGCGALADLVLPGCGTSDGQARVSCK